jgi:ATP-dependent Clp protease protease subunit
MELQLMASGLSRGQARERIQKVKGTATPGAGGATPTPGAGDSAGLLASLATLRDTFKSK